MNTKYNEEKNKDLDQGWAWVVMVAASLAGVLNGILIYAAGVIHVALLQRYQEDNAYTALIGSIFTSLLSLVGPVASMLINLYSCRTTMFAGSLVLFIGFVASYFAVNNLNFIFITYGIVAGTGLGLCATPPLVIIGYFFHLKRGIAIAVVVSGAGVGMFVAGPLVQFCITNFGLHGTFLLLAAFSSNHMVLGALMRPSELEFKHKTDVKCQNEKTTNNITSRLRNILHFDILLDKAFMFCNLQFFIWNIPFSMLFLHLTNYAVVQGSTKEDAALLITYIGIGSTLSRILTGLSIGHKGLDPVLLNFGFNGIAGLLTVLFPLYSSTFNGQAVFSVLFGIYSGGLATMINPICMELIGVAKISSGIGTMYFIGGVGYLIGPPIAGVILDKGGMYENTFYLSGILFLVAALITLLCSKWRVTQEDVNDVTVSLDNLQDEKTVLTHKTLLHRDITVEVTSDMSQVKHGELIMKADSIIPEFVNEYTPLSNGIKEES